MNCLGGGFPPPKQQKRKKICLKLAKNIMLIPRKVKQLQNAQESVYAKRKKARSNEPKIWKSICEVFSRIWNMDNDRICNWNRMVK